MSRVLWFVVGYFAGLYAVGLSYWNALSPTEQYVALSFAVVLAAAVFVDRHVAPGHVDGDADV